MSKNILGLDIRNDCISAVLVQRSIKGILIQAHEHVLISQDNISSALATICDKIDISNSVCIASFPIDQISFRNIQIPFKEQKKIKQVLPFEIETALPFPINDLVIDFTSIKPPADNNQTDILAVAIEKSKLQSYLDELASFNIDPQIVMPNGYPLALYLATFENTYKNIMFIDIGVSKAAAFIIVSGQICLARSFSTNKSNNLHTNINWTLCAFEEICPLDSHPEIIFIAGYIENDDSFDQDVTQTLGIPVKRVNIANDITQLHGNLSEQMDNALALALIEIEKIKGINFRIDSFAPVTRWAAHKKSLIKTGIFAGLILILVFCNMLFDSYVLEKKVNAVDKQIIEIFKETFPDVKRIVDPFQQMKIKIQQEQKISVFYGNTQEHIFNIDMLNDISKFIPKTIDVDLTRLTIGEENILIAGSTDTFNSVDDIKNGLEQSEFFKQVTINSADIEKANNRVRFNIKLWR